MNFAYLLQQLMDFLYNNLLLPISDFISDSQWGDHILSTEFKIGFGNITWISTTIGDILLLVIGLLVSITALVLTWKFIKMLTNFVRRMFGGVKR